MIQRSAEWFAARTGKITASRIADVCAMTKAGPSEKRRSYMMELIGERLTGDTADHFPSPAMQWGIDHEDEACSAYEIRKEVLVDLCGFIAHPSIKMTGASPDGLVGEEGILEIKCPTTKTHLETIMGGKVPAHNLHQIAWQIECTGRAWCDFVSFDPRLPAAYQIFVKRITREELVPMIEDIKAQVLSFLDEIAATMELLAVKAREA